MSASAGAIKAGRAFVEITADDAQMSKTLARTQARLRVFASAVESIGKALSIAGTLSVGSFLGATKVFMSTGDQLDKMSSRTGVAVEALSELSFAADQANVSAEDLEAGIRKMQKTIGDAADGSGAAIEALGKLGMTTQQLLDLSPDQQFELLADRLSQVTDPTLRAAAAMDVFGKNGTSLLPMITEGAAGLAAMRARARELGLVMSAETARSAAKLNDDMAVMKRVVGFAAAEVGGALVPILTKGAAVVQELAGRFSGWAKANHQVIQSIFKTSAGALGLGVTLTAVGKTVAGFTAILKAANTASFFLRANPLIAGLSALATVATLSAGAFGHMANETARLAAAQSELRAEGDALRSQDLARIDRLQKLAEKEGLNSSEKREALDLIAALQLRYGTLGITLDETTGKILNMAEAMNMLNQRMLDGTAAELKAELKALRAEADKLTGSLAPKQAKQVGGSAVLDTLNTASEATTGYLFGTMTPEQVERRLQETLAKIRAIQDRLGRMGAGDMDAMTGSQGRVGTRNSPLGDGDGDAGGSNAGEDNAEWIRRIRQLRLQEIEDTHAREIALLNERYDHERDLNINNWQRVKLISEARMLELGALRKAQEQQLYELELRHAEEVAAAREQRAVEVAAGNMDLERELQELRIRNAKAGIEEELAILELQRKFAIEDARQRGLREDLVNEKFDLLMQQAQEGVQAALDHHQFTSRGTFNAAALQGLQGGVDRFKPIENYTKRTAEAVEEIANKDGLTFG